VRLLVPPVSPFSSQDLQPTDGIGKGLPCLGRASVISGQYALPFGNVPTVELRFVLLAVSNTAAIRSAVSVRPLLKKSRQLMSDSMRAHGLVMGVV
jgi:hypothetical protein